MVNITLRVLSKPSVQQLPTIYKVGEAYHESPAISANRKTASHTWSEPCQTRLRSDYFC